VPASPLIGFVAQTFREVEAGSDVGEFRVITNDGIRMIYVSGADLLLVRAPSKVL
jgi:hypothetical protein